MLDSNAVENLILQAIPEAEVSVQDYSGSGDKFQVVVRAKCFAGKTRIAQHQMVYAALQEHLDSGALHAVALNTQVME